MGKRSFTWNPNGVCIFGSYSNPKSECMFDYWSILHLYFTGFAYIILHHLLKISSVKGALILTFVLTIFHGTEEYLGNTNKISLEGIVLDYLGPLIDPKVNPKNREVDNDYLENSIGDVLSGVVACILIITYWYYYKKLPYLYLLGIVIMVYMLLRKAHMLYD